MYRCKIENVLQSWLDDASHKPLVVKGVRQCGKTSSVMDFAQKHFKNVVYLDFREHPDYKKFFTPNLEADSIIMRITAAMPNVEIEAGNTCFVFDEIQDCPLARGSLKYFHLDGRYEVMCTGSLLGVNGYKTPDEKKEEEEASIPMGFEDIVDMYPMDFEEWLWANGIKDMHIEYLKKCLVGETPVEEALHDRFRLTDTASKVSSRYIWPTSLAKWGVNCIIIIKMGAWNLIFSSVIKGDVLLWNVRPPLAMPSLCKPC